MQLPSSPSRQKHAIWGDSEHISLTPSTQFPRPPTPILPSFSEAAEASSFKGLRPSLHLQRKDTTLRCKPMKTAGLEIAGRNPRDRLLSAFFGAFAGFGEVSEEKGETEEISRVKVV